MNTETIEGMKMVTIPSGSFMMGHNYEYEPGIPERVNRFYADEQPVHKVSVKEFQMGEMQVTQAQYEKITGENFSTFKGGDLPVTNLGPHEIINFCNKLSLAAGLNPCYDTSETSRTPAKCDFTKNGFRMPTEA